MASEEIIIRDGQIRSNQDHQILYVHNLTNLDEIVRLFSNINFSLNERESILSNDEEEVVNHTFLFWVEGVALTLISLFGIMGTSMSIRVLLQPDVRESFSGLLTGLAFCDVLFLIFSVFLFGIPKMWPWFGIRVANRLMPVGIGVIHIWRVGSTAITVSITIERYFAIVQPLKRFIYQRHLLIGSLLFATFYNISRFFEFKSVRMSTGEYALMASDLRNDPLYIQIYVFWSKFLLVELVPWITIVVLNTLILLTIMRSVRFRGQFASSSISRPSGVQITSGQRRKIFKHNSTRTNNGLNENMPSNNNRSIKSSQDCTLKHGMKRSKSLPTFQKNESQSDSLKRKKRRQQRRKSMPITIERRLSRRRHFRSLHDIIPSTPARSIMNPSRSFISPPITSSTTSSTDLGRTLIGVSVLFLFCQSFKIIPDIYEGVWCNIRSKDSKIPFSCPSNTIIDVLISLSNLLMCINSAMNFVMYMLRGSKFRLAFCKTYKLHRWQKLYYFLRKKGSSPTQERGQVSHASNVTTTVYVENLRGDRNFIRVNDNEN